MLLPQEQRQGPWVKVSPDRLSPEIDMSIRSPYQALLIFRLLSSAVTTPIS